MKIKVLIILSIISLVSCSKQDEFLLSSPNEELRITINNNTSTFSVIYDQDTILKQSAIGLTIDGINYSENVSYSDFAKTEFDETWSTVIGKQTTVRNQYNEYTFSVSNPKDKQEAYEIIFRLYDKGFAYRYNFPSDVIGDSLLIEKESTRLNINCDYTYWAYNGEKHNLGPILRSEKNIDKVRIPVVLKLHNKKFMAIHEAEIVEFTPFSINAAIENGSLGFNTNYSSRNHSFKTSWRAFMIGDKVGDLVESNLLENLNEPSKIEDPSWIKPGKSLWDWRVLGYKTGNSYIYEPNTESHKKLINFASENNIQYLIIDADWYGSAFSESSDPTTSKKGIDIQDCMQYAAERGVGVILYLNDIGAKKFGLERVLKQFSEWGAVGVKYGFMKGNAEEKVKHTLNVIELCAKYKLMVNFHDNPIPPNGDSRTWPNLVAKEYGHAQADAKRSHFPETSVNHPLINLIAGPLDLTNGWFDLNNAHAREKVFQEIPGTVVAEVAKLITIYSGWMVLPDSPEEYLKKDDLFDCIRMMPAQFDNYKVLDARMDEFVCIGRKSGDDWFIGSLTNREKRTIILDLSFLPADKLYEATFYEDADDAHYQSNKEAYTIQKEQANSKSKLTIKMGVGGGNVIYLKNIGDQMK